MKKLISLLLTLCLLMMGLCAAEAEEADETQVPAISPEDEVQNIPGAGYAFDFTLQAHPEVFSGKEKERIQGYADLLEALRFQGSFSWALDGQSFELRLAITPLDSQAAPITLWIHGAEDLMYLQSSLLADKTVKLSNYSMLGFCAKMSEHLGLPLHYLALMYPYSWVYGLGLPIQDWEGMTEKEDANGVIPAEAVQYLWDCWAYRLEYDEPVRILVDALCKDTDMEDAFRGFLSEIPDYFVKQVAQEDAIQILREGDTVTWRTATGDIYTEKNTEQGGEIALNLPWMRNNYRPVFTLETFRENQSVSGHLTAQILGGEGLEDLVNLQASFVAFPQTWPADCYSLLSLDLTGGLLPNLGLSCYLIAEESGHVKAEFKKPTVETDPGSVMLTAEGMVTPLKGEVTVRQFSLLDGEEALDLFVANDTEIQAFLPELRRPMIEGMLRFLVGIPTSACQTIMDDLTELGVFEVLMGQ